MSGPPPAPNGSIIRTGFAGYSAEPCSITTSEHTSPKTIHVDMFHRLKDYGVTSVNGPQI
jgi:hypothetical protein